MKEYFKFSKIYDLNFLANEIGIIELKDKNIIIYKLQPWILDTYKLAQHTSKKGVKIGLKLK